MFRRGFLSLAILLGGLFSSSVAHAAMMTTWDFTNAAQVEGWQIDGLDVRQGPDGLHIRGNGVMMRSVDATHRIDAINVIFAKSLNIPGVFAWHRTNTPNNEFVQLSMPMTPGAPVTQELPLHTIPEWDPWADVIGFQFQTNEEIILTGMEFKGWSAWEKAGFAWQSFWKIDRTLAFTINFLWGPLTVFTPGEITTLYDAQPPRAWSAHRFSFGFLGLVILIIAGLWALKRFQGSHLSRKQMITAFFAACAVLWAVHDVRMGYELTHNWVQDLQQYTFAEPGTKKFRNLLTFHDGLFQNMDLFTSVQTYAVFAPDGSPLRKMAGYHTYPFSRPLTSDQSTIDATVFYVFYDDRVAINANNELQYNGVVASKPGHVAKKIDDRAFIFIVP